MTTVVISQPMYFPWPGYYELVALADVYIHLDDAQFSKGSFTNRIQIKHTSGIKWMTIPLADKGAFQQIKSLQAGKPGWQRAHRDLLFQSLRSAPRLDLALPLFDDATSRARLCDVLITSVELPTGLLGVKCQRWLRASEMSVEGTSWRRVLDLVHAVGGTRYVTAHGAANYLDHDAFEREGVTVEYIQYSKTPWRQLNGPFTPYVSVLDLIANSGSSASECILPSTVPWRSFVTPGAASDGRLPK